MLLCGAVQERQLAMLEAAFDNLAVGVHYACKADVLVKFDDLIAECTLHGVVDAVGAINRLHGKPGLYDVAFLYVRRIMYPDKLGDVGVVEILGRILGKHHLTVGAIDFLKARFFHFRYCPE